MSASPPKADIRERVTVCPLCARSGHSLLQTLPGAIFAVNGATPAKNSGLASAGGEPASPNGVPCSPSTMANSQTPPRQRQRAISPVTVFRAGPVVARKPQASANHTIARSPELIEASGPDNVATGLTHALAPIGCEKPREFAALYPWAVGNRSDGAGRGEG